MADANDETLPPALVMRCVISRVSNADDEEKTNEFARERSETMEPSAHPWRASGGDVKAPLKDTLGESAAAVETGGIDSDGEDGTLKSQSLKRRVSPRAVPANSPSSTAMRSPSRLATSLLVGRDRMARAARAWRDGARRAGLLGGDDDFDNCDDDDLHNTETTNESKANPIRGGVDVDGMRGSVLDATSAVVGTEADADELPRALRRLTAPSEPHDEDPADVKTPVRASIAQIAPRLVPSRLAPATRLPKMAQLWMFLDRIECLSIRDVYTTHDDDDSGPTVHYVLDVYTYQEQHSIPTLRYQGFARSSLPRRPLAPPATPPRRQPDYHIQHRFSNFIKLRSRVLKAAQCKHPRAPHQADATRPPSSSSRHCAYCRAIALFVATGSASIAPLGWKTKFFTTVEMRKALLSQFISELVFLAREQRDACSNLVTLSALHQPPSRYVHRSVPGILRRFLTVQTGENFMR